MGQSSKPSKRRAIMKEASEIPISKRAKKMVRIRHNHMAVRKNKSDDGAISESEVIETVASKFDGPRITKGHAPDTSNYPTSRPQKSNLR
ncbi:hypothetical protein H5410_021157 [Solanum commersonii]|uniref:Uncharacterized protein n=1 Tax=Solanum commersonii TaxID=4109 RepID=A0A9J5ZEC7_SOLCO|nr:hypothetical protein H5410_021157 [Solanum commersonii]